MEIKRATKHEKKMRWLAENESQLEAKYPGMWVAISDDGLAGVGSTSAEAVEKARERGITDVLVGGVKRKEYQGIPLVRRCR